VEEKMTNEVHQKEATHSSGVMSRKSGLLKLPWHFGIECLLPLISF